MSQPQAERTAPVVPHAVATAPSVRALLLVSAACLVVQVGLTDHGPEEGVGWFWLVAGALLLWFVHRRRSGVAHAVIVVTALVGAVRYGLAAVDDAREAVVAVAFAGQAAPLVAAPVRQHVQGRPRTPFR